MATSEVPWKCRLCGHENWVNLDNLSMVQMGPVITNHGFFCQKCGLWVPVFYATPTMQDAMIKLDRSRPGSQRFGYFFWKTLKKAIGIRLRVERQHNGSG